MNKINTINGVLMASQDELNEHVENGTAHVTEEERIVWNTQASVNAKGIVIATQGDLDEHAGNKAIHLTEEERTAWNAKADTSDLVSKVDVETFNAHKGDDTVHITEKDRNSWNGKQDKLTDDEGNMTLAGRLTTVAAINANGGVNLPIAPADWRHAVPLVDMASVMMMSLGQVDSFIGEVTSVEGSATAITPGMTYSLKCTTSGGDSVHKINIGDVNDGWNSFPSGIMYQIGHGVHASPSWKLTQLIGNPPITEALSTDINADNFVLDTSSVSINGMVLSITCMGQNMSTPDKNLTVEIVYYDDAAQKWIRQITDCIVPYGGYGGNSASIYVHGLLLVWPPRRYMSSPVTGALYAVLSRDDNRLVKLADVPWRYNNGEPRSVVGSMYVNMFKYWMDQSLVIRAPRILNLGINKHDTLCDVLGAVTPSVIKSTRVVDYNQPV